MEKRSALLTGLCALFLAASFLPGCAALAYVSVLFGAIPAVPSAWEAIRTRQVDVEFLMVLAAAGAVGVGRPSDAAGLLFLFALSGTLEKFAMAKTKSAIEGLIKLRPSTALRLEGTTEKEVPVEQIVIGDHLRIPAFAPFPVDGVVIEGTSQGDFSAMTGESVPVALAEGDRVLAGVQNLEGTLLVRAESQVGNSTLDKIVGLVAEAQDNKASGERVSAWFGQRYTYFVLAAFGVSLVGRLVFHTHVWNHALYDSLTLLVALSPCALVISTPATTLSALAWAARHGMLIRGGEFIERAGEIEQIALDKTGTLTTGKPKVAQIVVSGTEAATSVETENRWLSIAASLEQYSNHPIAVAILQEHQRRKLELPPVENHRTHAGLGVSGTVNNAETRLGQEKFLTQAGHTLPDSFLASVHQIQDGGFTVALLQHGDQYAAISLSDTVRPEASAVLAELKSLGVKRLVMMTGDTQETAESVGKALGLDEIHAGLMPEDKTKILSTLTEKGPTMMVGDGVNDAPSLALANLGVAMGGLGSDIAMNAADIVLMKDRLESLPELILLGRKTKRIIRANLVFAGAMIVGLTAASFITTLPLPIAVVGHEGSTVLVILNGLRLLRGPR